MGFSGWAGHKSLRHLFLVFRNLIGETLIVELERGFVNNALARKALFFFRLPYRCVATGYPAGEFFLEKIFFSLIARRAIGDFFCGRA